MTSSRGRPTGLAFGAGSLWVADGRAARSRRSPGVPTRSCSASALATPRTRSPRATPVSGRLRGRRAPSCDRRRSGTAGRADRSAGAAVRHRNRRRLDLGREREAPRASSGSTRVRANRWPSIRVGNGPSAVAVGAGAVWVANRVDGTVSRIDPHSEVAEIGARGARAARHRGRPRRRSGWADCGGGRGCSASTGAAAGRPGRSPAVGAALRPWRSSAIRCVDRHAGARLRAPRRHLAGHDITANVDRHYP